MYKETFLTTPCHHFVPLLQELDMIQAIRFECYSYGPVELLPPVVANMKNLRWVDWRGYYASPFPTNFPPRELCCLILDCYSQKQLWKGYKVNSTCFSDYLMKIKVD